MFGGVVTKLNLSKAATVVQNLLEMHGQGTHAGAAAGAVANKLVAKVYSERPAMFDGKEGKRPHKLATAAISLAWGMKFLVDHPEDQLAMRLALGTILLEVSGKPQHYAFSGNDRKLFQLAEEHYLAEVA